MKIKSNTKKKVFNYPIVGIKNQKKDEIEEFQEDEHLEHLILEMKKED
jgi:hypothetical protein